VPLVNNGVLLDLARQRQEQAVRRADLIGPHVAELRAHRQPLVLRIFSKLRARHRAGLAPDCTVQPMLAFCYR